MQKVYTTLEYKAFHKRKLIKIKKKRRRKANLDEKKSKKKIWINADNLYRPKNLKPTLYPPNDLRLINNTEECLLFFRNLRSEDYLNYNKKAKYVIISLKHVTQIDYGTISILISISDELRLKKIVLKGDLPENHICRKFMVDSGFLNHFVDEKGKPFIKAEKSDLIFFEKGCGKLSIEENKKISSTVKNIVNFLTGENSQCRTVKSIILEICGNSIEWSGTYNKQWLLGVKYDQDRVIVTVTDIGIGILNTLYRKFRNKISDAFLMRKDNEVLSGAFDQKYGSSSKEVNRNKGLPAIKQSFIQGKILSLKVLTNNVILHFDDESLSRTFKKGDPWFKGTFYQWEMTKDCINKSSKKLI